jgi:adenine-specific DNA-methyltransferase
MAKKEQTVTIKPAKGRPMLQWVGKRPLSRLTAFPAQTVETFGEDPENGSRLYHGDNKEVLAHLLANGYRGKVDLIYIDPPFDSGADYVRKVELRGHAGRSTKMNAEGYALGEQIQYTDIWANDNYLQFMYERLALLKELLTPTGALYVHCDSRKSHFLKILMDEVMGSESFRNEVSWIRTASHNDTTKRYSRVRDSILFYATGTDITFNTRYSEYGEDYIESEWNKLPSGRFWKCENMLDPRGTMKAYDFHGTRARWRTSPEKLEELWNQPQTEVPNSHGRIKLGRNGKPIRRCRIMFLDELPGVQLSEHWGDIAYIAGRAKEAEGYPTQKPEALLERILDVSTAPGDLVLDCFIGSGTTAAVAQKLGRRWIGCDINKGAIQTTAKRLQTIIAEQVAERAKRKKTPELIKDENAPPEPAQYGFTVHRVNDYDLQIQHNEAVALACEHIGVTRTRSDAFFDGTLGKRLVKIVPFNHPLSPLDMEEVKKELDARPEEQRDIMIVALGKELAVEKWLDDWHRLRKRGDVPNKIEVVELRTDPKYGKFFAHKPATARVEIKRLKTKLKVEIKDFISPSIVERLEDQSGVLKPKIDDWRAMVDCVMVDPAYDGTVFNVALSDIPEKKTDLVQGAYELAPPKAKKATVAVKIIDMLGEEVLITKDV